MFVFENPSDVDTDWFLGHKNQSLGCIPKKLLQCISNFHMLGIQFLFENYIRKRNGAILNQDEDMNMPLQVATFLNSVQEKISIDLPVAIICQDSHLCKWHFHTSECDFKSNIVSSEEIGSYEVYIISSKSIKLMDHLLKLDLFCVVIDDLDLIAAKRIVPKLRGIFNIGLTRRNFYMNPDQKLKWLMLNWVSPGCVGKLNDFYSIDRSHSLALADNYRYWWMRLTWNFCDSFERPTDEELQDYHQKLNTWGTIHKIGNNLRIDETKSKRKFLGLEEQSKVKKQKLVVKDMMSNNALTISSSNNLFDTSSDQRNDEDINRSNQEPSKIIEDLNKAASTSSLMDNETVIKEESKSDIIIDMFSKSSTANKKNISDDEDPIISILNSRNQLKSEQLTHNSFEIINNSAESSESDSEFLSNFVKNRNKSVSSRYHKISNVLNNLTDDEENVLSENEFFNELVSNRKKL
ncbi:hypothetical protein WA026_000382 [Henosepilachna vigintioctopunctata]|uniref:Uncharacterized protein n=1 Tax=Henosepilachna vigintioctopunctata TaxID=420089 RepID=A0AAW1V731_9CUCU